MAKYTPKNKYELKKLVADESIYLGDIDTSNITDMEELFCESKRRDFSGIETWDTSNVLTMSFMFSKAEYFNHNINNWNVSKVVAMNGMFNGAKLFNQPLNNWNVSNVATMDYMFSSAESFNQPLDNWDTSSAMIMIHMFKEAESFNQNLDSWNVDSVESNKDMLKNSGMKNLPMWWSDDKCKELSINQRFTANDFVLSKTMRKHIKKDSQSGKYVPKTRNELWALCYDNEISLGDIDTSNIVDMSLLFANLHSKRRDFSGIETWDVSKVVDMTEMFEGARYFNHNINSWDVSNVVSMYYMFYRAESFNQPLDNWDTSSVEFMGSMFYGAKSFNQNIDSWNVRNVRDNAEMFWDSGVDKLPKWYKKKEISDYNIINERIDEVLANPQSKAKPQQRKAQSDNFNFWQGKNAIILVIVALLIGVSAGFIKSKFKESNKAKSPPTQTTQPVQNKQTQKQTQSAQNMIRCNDKDLLNHIVKRYREDLLKEYKSDPKLLAGLQEISQQNGVVFTNIDDFVNQSRFNVTISYNEVDEANKQIFCSTDIEMKLPFFIQQSEDNYRVISKLWEIKLNDGTIITLAYAGKVL